MPFYQEFISKFKLKYLYICILIIILYTLAIIFMTFKSILLNQKSDAVVNNFFSPCKTILYLYDKEKS